MTDAARTLGGIGALAEPVRRALYECVVASAEPLGREQAAEAVGVPLHTAKFHLDRLVDDGLLDVEYRRLSGRTGPGAGRPAKLYRRSAREFAVSFPPRHYDLAGQILADAVDRAGDGAALDSALSEAAQRAAYRVVASRPPAEAPGERVDEVLAGSGTNRARRPAGCAWSTAPSTPSRRSTPPWSAGSTAPSSRGCSTPWDAPTSWPASRPPRGSAA